MLLPFVLKEWGVKIWRLPIPPMRWATPMTWSCSTQPAGWVRIETSEPKACSHSGTSSTQPAGWVRIKTSAL